MNLLRYVLPMCRVMGGLICFIVALLYRTALLTTIRPLLIWIIPCSALGIAAWSKRSDFFLRRFTWSFTFAALGLFAWQEVHFRLSKRTIANADAQKLTQVGQHFIIGYRDFNEAKYLVEKNAIAGIYLSHRYLRDSSLEELRQELRMLQAIRRQKEQAPLIIMADQEGGVVSHLSPPLTKLPSLAEIVGDASIEELASKEDEIRAYAHTHGRELQDLGVTMNLAPVVDLQSDSSVKFDQFSLIHRRAISRDPRVVAQVAQWYCEGLAEFAITCTLKHFPGLACIDQDTHFFAGRVRASIEEMMEQDWLPFRHLLGLDHLQPAVMMSHTYVDAIDPQLPASLSARIMIDLVREQWKHRGLIMSDDFSMFPTSLRWGGVGQASVDALNHGVDLILLSYDTDLYYEAMAEVLETWVYPIPGGLYESK